MKTRLYFYSNRRAPRSLSLERFLADDLASVPDGDPNCSTTGLVKPAVEFAHADGACSVIGGFVYRGAAIPEIVGHYFYSDWCGGWLRSFRYDGGSATNEIEWDVVPFGMPVSFGVDGDGELYILTDSGLYRIVRQ